MPLVVGEAKPPFPPTLEIDFPAVASERNGIGVLWLDATSGEGEIDAVVVEAEAGMEGNGLNAFPRLFPVDSPGGSTRSVIIDRIRVPRSPLLTSPGISSCVFLLFRSGAVPGQARGLT